MGVGKDITDGNFSHDRANAWDSDKLRTQRSMVADPLGAVW